MELLSELMVWLVIINVFIIVHFVRIVKNKKSPVHWVSFTAAFVLSFVLSVATYPNNPLFQALSMLFLGFVYWIAFPLQLNLFTGKPLLYLGIDEDGEEDSLIDKIERKMKNPGMTLIMKLVIAIAISFILLDLPCNSCY